MSPYNFLSCYKTYLNIFQTVSEKSFPSLSQYLILIQVKDIGARTWHEKEALEQSWSVRTLHNNQLYAVKYKTYLPSEEEL